MAQYSYEIGANAGARVNVEDLAAGFPPPRGEHNRYTVVRVGGDGKSVGDGFPRVTWTFDYLTIAAFNILMAYITGASTSVSIKTRLDDGTYQAYASAIMHRPELPRGARRVFLGYRDIVIVFTRCEI